MRKLLVLPLVLVVLVAAGAAAGATSKTVTISHTGYTPTAVAITTGDTVVFKNTDTVAHTVAFNSTTGMHCSATVPLVIAAGKSADCTFSTAGNFKFSDPASNKKAFKGTITVAGPLVSSLTVKPKTITYGRTSTISGTLVSGQSGQAVQIRAQGCKDTKSSIVATVTTTAGGAFSYQAQPSNNTSYTLSSKGLTATTSVGVKPRLQLAKIGAHRYKVQIYAAQNFLGTRATFQRYRSSSKRWVAVKRVKLHTSVTKSPTVITSAKFRSAIKAHQLVRASLGPKQVAPCYVAAHSNTIRS